MTKDTFKDMNDYNRITSLETLLPMISKIAQNLSTDDETRALKEAFITVLFFAGSQSQYHEFKNNY
jgi:hypothetical protein